MFVLEMIISSSLAAYESPSSSSPYNDYDPLQQSTQYLELFNGAEKNNFNAANAPSWAEWSSDRERIRFWRWKNRNRLRNIRRAARLGLTTATAAGDSGFRNGRQNLKKKSLPRSGHQHMHPQRSQNHFEYNLPQEKYVMLENMTTDSCCPTQMEVVEPTKGRNRGGHLVDLYHDDLVKQHFYEYSCKTEVVDKPCRFLENRHSKQSKCTQLHTYTYALVRKDGKSKSSDPGPSYHEDSGRGHGHGHGHGHAHVHSYSHHHTQEQPWILDYIMIRSGCGCQIDEGTTRKKKRMFPRKG